MRWRTSNIRYYKSLLTREQAIIELRQRNFANKKRSRGMDINRIIKRSKRKVDLIEIKRVLDRESSIIGKHPLYNIS